MAAALLIASQKYNEFLTSLRKPDVKSKPVSLPLGNQNLGPFQNTQWLTLNLLLRCQGMQSICKAGEILLIISSLRLVLY